MAPYDGFAEREVQVSSTALVHFPQWAMILLAAILAIAGASAMRRHHT